MISIKELIIAILNKFKINTFKISILIFNVANADVYHPHKDSLWASIILWNYQHVKVYWDKKIKWLR